MFGFIDILKYNKDVNKIILIMAMLRAIKVRLYPNKQQEQALNKVLGCYRFLYNHMLALKQESYKSDKTNLSLNELSKYFHHELRKDEQYVWLKEQNTQVMGQSIRQMLTAYDKFFKEHKGFPKFKSKKDKQSALFPLNAISKRNTFETRHITLVKQLKNIKFRCSDLYHKRLQRYKDNIRSATLSKTKSGNFFLSILMNIPQSEFVKFKKTNKEVGIDLGVKDFVITSDGKKFENKHFFKKDERKLNRLQRQLSKKKVGSKNHNKQRIKIAKAFEHITNKKENYIHYVVNELLSSYDTIYMEDLSVSGMLKNHHLAKAISEVGFYKFKEILKSKAIANDKKVVLIDKFYPSSKTCSQCGYIHKGLKLKDRHWQCPQCGEIHDRDLNAAKNILCEGQRISAA
jgi:transposase, IS605 OrfB family, central region